MDFEFQEGEGVFVGENRSYSTASRGLQPCNEEALKVRTQYYRPMKR